MYTWNNKIILASSSPRRIDLLKTICSEFEVIPSDADETPLNDESAACLVERLACLKAQEVADRYLGEEQQLQTKDFAVIGCDTVVECDQKIYGKPENRNAAKENLRILSGRTHNVWSSFCIKKFLPEMTSFQDLVFTAPQSVTFRELSELEIENYLNSQEYQGKAGSYAIQGIAASFVTKLDGSYSAVLGLDLCMLIAKCRELGIAS
jgi:septum formation protein